MPLERLYPIPNVIQKIKAERDDASRRAAASEIHSPYHSSLPLALPQLTKGSPTLSRTVVSGPERPGKRFLPEGMKRTNLGSRQKVIGSGSRDCQGKQPSEIIPSQAKELRRLLLSLGKG